MFKKIVSNIPYHPAMIGQLTFYMHRLKQENAIRKAGFLLFALVMFIQLFAILSPSKPSLATSANDIVYGASSKNQVLTAYNNNRDGLGRTDIRAIYNHYGIGANQINSATKQKIGSRDKDYVSTGRNASPGVDNFINIDGVANGGIYQRDLKSWDVNGFENSYDTLTGLSQNGFRFWIIIDGCGNIVFERGALKPRLDIIKKRMSPNNIKAGGSVSYKIEFRNTGVGTAKNVKIKDKLSKYYSYESFSSNIDLKLNQTGQNLSWIIDNKNSQLSPTSKWFFINLRLKVRDNLDVDKICNSASISASNASTVNTNDTLSQRCINIIPDTPPPSPEPRISTDKSVENITQGIKDANNTHAKPGDVLKYTIYIINNGEATMKNLPLTGEYGESINDILEYADLTDKGDAIFDSKTNYLSWGPVTVSPGRKVSKSFSVTIKDPLPSTPTSASDPLSYDFIMQNIYGRTITVKLDKPASKIIEQSVQTLPSTGPGTSMIIITLIATIVGYFYYRSRLLSKEIEIVHHEFSGGGV